MNTSTSGHKTSVDHGVQIRFINDLHEYNGGQPNSQPKTKSQTFSKYGVAVRVQGIAGQPYVVLKDGKKGDSYGVQLKTQYPSGYGSLPRRREKGEPTTHGLEEVEGREGALRRAQSHGSLLDREGVAGDEFQLPRPPGDGKSGSYGNLDSGLGVRGAREPARNVWDGTYQARLNGSVGSPVSDSQAFTGAQQHAHSVNRLANRFDDRSGGQQRGLSPSNDPRAVHPRSTTNHYTLPSFSTHSSPVRSQNAQPNIPGPPVNKRTSGRYVAVETEPQVTPDLLMDQSAEMSIEEEQIMQTIYSILREGSNESDASIKHKVNIICQRIQNLQHKEPPSDIRREKRQLERKVAELQNALQKEKRGSVSNADKVLKDELESCLDANLQLQETLDRKKKELSDSHSE